MSRKGNIYEIDGLPATYTLNMSEEKWLALRRQGIGGSDIGAILGLNQYRTPLTVWMEKRGLAKPQETNPSIEFGNRMEPVLRRWAEGEVNAGGGDLKVLSSPYLYQHRTVPIFIANVDGVILDVALGEDALVAGLEIKTAGEYQAKWWKGEEIPDSYYAQVQWYMAVTGLHYWVIAALVGKEFFTRQVPRNEDFITGAMARAAEFWDTYVTPGVMPAPTGAEADLEALIELFPGGGSVEVIEDQEMTETLAAYQDIQVRIKDQEALKNSLKAKIEARIGDAKVLLAGDLKASWSRFGVERVDADELRASYPEVYEKVKKPATQGRLTVGPAVKVKKEKKA
jgi:putative phage-type endonuclease